MQQGRKAQTNEKGAMTVSKRELTVGRCNYVEDGRSNHSKEGKNDHDREGASMTDEEGASMTGKEQV